jgi:hypothetical protein
VRSSHARPPFYDNEPRPSSAVGGCDAKAYAMLLSGTTGYEMNVMRQV